MIMTETVRITTSEKTVELSIKDPQLDQYLVCEEFEDQSIQSIEWIGVRSESREHFFFGYYEN